jgi:hypothetical protein
MLLSIVQIYNFQFPELSGIGQMRYQPVTHTLKELTRPQRVKVEGRHHRDAAHSMHGMEQVCLFILFSRLSQNKLARFKPPGTPASPP